MTDFRALCQELLEALENAIRVIYHEDGTKHISTADAVISKANAALAQSEPQGPSDEELGLLHEANNILCAANHALKTIDGVLETTIDEEDGYTFCDLVGDVYSIRRALVLLDGCIKTGGLKGDPVR